jgi:hypothetical protein
MSTKNYKIICINQNLYVHKVLGGDLNGRRVFYIREGRLTIYG